MTVKMASLEQKLREKDNELEGKDDVIEKHVKTESENLEQIRMLEVELKSKDELLQTALAQVDSVDIQSRNDNSNKEKDAKIARYGSYISKLLVEIKSLKSKQNPTNKSDHPVNEII